ncbi:MAG: ATP-binding protein, partial [Nitrososphaera sp.]
SIFDLYSQVSDDTKKHLMQLVEGPFSELFREESGADNNATTTAADMLSRTIISLQGAYDNQERQAILLTLALAKAWKYLISAPAHVPKVLVVDEGWLVFKIPSTARFIEMIARTGRKLNVLFLFISQNPEDVIKQETGRAILENADTKILLRNTEIAAHMVAETLWLSQREKEMLPVLQNGEALMFAGEHRLRVKITPRSQEELRVFSTNPVASVNDGNATSMVDKR